jgi:uncharacterized membrane protein
VVGGSVVGSHQIATEWNDGAVINLGGLAGSTDSYAYGLNDSGDVVGWSLVSGQIYATEWTGDQVINLGALLGTTNSSYAYGINDAGVVVGASAYNPPFSPVPEPSTWAMMLIGFAGLSYAGYRRPSGARELRAV